MRCAVITGGDRCGHGEAAVNPASCETASSDVQSGSEAACQVIAATNLYTTCCRQTSLLAGTLTSAAVRQQTD